MHFDGPAFSDTSTLFSGSTASAYGEPNRRLPLRAEPQPGIRTPSANSLSISYVAGTKRLVINAEIVEKLKIHRSDGRVEIRLRVEKDDVNGLNGIIVGPFISQSRSVCPFLRRAGRELIRNNQVVLFIGYIFSRGGIGSHRSPLLKGKCSLRGGVACVPGQGTSSVRAQMGKVRRCARVAEKHVRADVLVYSGRGR